MHSLGWSVDGTSCAAGTGACQCLHVLFYPLSSPAASGAVLLGQVLRRQVQNSNLVLKNGQVLDRETSFGTATATLVEQCKVRGRCVCGGMQRVFT